jgi:proteasome accessory factor A
MNRRIFGLETEFGVTCAFEGHRRLSPDEVARYLFRKVVSWGRSSNVFLRNGSRLYLDVGSHPEYATPECDDVRQLVVHDRAGERILEGLAVDAERRLAEEGIAGEVYLFKNNTDSAGNSYGCHENYLVSRQGEFARLSDVLIPFLVSRQLVTGAGKVMQTPRGALYSLSQRADHIWEGVSSATTRSRPIINTRDEPHADAERYRRLHVIVGDSSMSETTTLLKVGSTDLVLRLIEAGIPTRDLTLENPIRAIREISHDLTGRRPVRLANGRTAAAMDIQVEYLERVRGFLDSGGLDVSGPRGDAVARTAKHVVDLWERALRAIQTDDLGLVEREIDWVIKLRLLQRYMARNGLALDHPRIARLDLAYHDVNRDRGLYNLMARRGLVERISTDIEVFEATVVPPQTTRAKLRGDFVKAAQEHRRDFTVDWVHLKLNDQAQRTVLCKDPFRAVDERVERLIASM